MFSVLAIAKSLYDSGVTVFSHSHVHTIWFYEKGDGKQQEQKN